MKLRLAFAALGLALALLSACIALEPSPGRPATATLPTTALPPCPDYATAEPLVVTVVFGTEATETPDLRTQWNATSVAAYMATYPIGVYATRVPCATWTPNAARVATLTALGPQPWNSPADVTPRGIETVGPEEFATMVATSNFGATSRALTRTAAAVTATPERTATPPP